MQMSMSAWCRSNSILSAHFPHTHTRTTMIFSGDLHFVFYRSRVSCRRCVLRTHIVLGGGSFCATVLVQFDFESFHFPLVVKLKSAFNLASGKTRT